MRKLVQKICLKLAALIIICTALVLISCAVQKVGGFGIYLTEGDILPARMPALSHVDIVESPIVSINDIITYNAQTHEVELTASAFQRISRLNVPVTGRSFLVCVDRKPIYWGAFWTPISSMSFDGVTIQKPLTSGQTRIIRLELVYPSSTFYGGEDPRNNPEVMRSLDQAGKLITRPAP